jgi:hypothetical protein
MFSGALVGSAAGAAVVAAGSAAGSAGASPPPHAAITKLVMSNKDKYTNSVRRIIDILLIGLFQKQ